MEVDKITMGTEEISEFDLEAAEEATTAAKYQEIRSKIAWPSCKPQSYYMFQGLCLLMST